MSSLKNLLWTASRQYTSLLRNGLNVQTVQCASLCSSKCLRSDVSKVNVAELVDRTEEAGVTKSSLEENISDDGNVKKTKYNIPRMDRDLMPGGEFIPGEEIYEHTVDGVKYEDLPRIFIKATMQNTLASAFVKNNGIASQTGGLCGFKNSKKKSNVCGQTVGFAIGSDVLKKGHKNVCVVVKGVGAGRLPAIKGIQMAGLNIISITDMTYPMVSGRQRKPRRV
ncbi:28S ribosomal protein S11 [Mactra antiquata]